MVGAAAVEACQVHPYLEPHIETWVVVAEAQACLECLQAWPADDLEIAEAVGSVAAAAGLEGHSSSCLLAVRTPAHPQAWPVGTQDPAWLQDVRSHSNSWLFQHWRYSPVDLDQAWSQARLRHPRRHLQQSSTAAD